MTGAPAHLPAPTLTPAAWSSAAALARAAAQAPMLTEAEERRLIAAVQDAGDRAAAWRLVWAHLRLVAACVRKHHRWGLPEGDLAQEGVVGMLKALKGFRSDMGNRFAAYARPWIEAEMLEYIMRNLRLVRLGSGKALRRLFFGYREALDQMGTTAADRPSAPRPEAIAAALGLKTEQIRDGLVWMQGGETGLPVMDDAAESDEMPPHAPPLALAAPESERPESRLLKDERDRLQRRMLQQIDALPAREAEVVRRRHLGASPETLQAIASDWKVSIERVRQIERRAMELLRVRCLAAGVDMTGDGE